MAAVLGSLVARMLACSRHSKLTSSHQLGKIVNMLGSFRRHARVPASATLFAVAVILSVTCLSAAGMTSVRKVCCVSTQHDCGGMAVKVRCCTGQAHETRSLAARKPTMAAVPPAVIVAVLTMPSALPASERHTVLAKRSSPSPPGVSTYLFVSSLRI